eukprot:TRINITY_DN74995_c0_g1_i1.p1 TRINITY_DN74995_c0_g1~~TRINITY_DN74995_c0_g1_i1.p1  ORF type:complete len:572 (+),score=116.48 TRINITY_DN74995_c0_g1_i1:184-1716(+)
MEESQAADLFDAADADGSGAVDLEEFIEWIFCEDEQNAGMAAVQAENKGWSLQRLNSDEQQGELSQISEMFKVPDPHNLGYGRDVRASDGKYNKLVVNHVWQIMGSDQTCLYQSAKKVMRRAMRKLKRVDDLSELPTRTKLDDVCSGFDLDQATNEKMMLHGTKPEVVLTIVQNGLDERFSGGLFGCGVYLSEDPSKIDQYCTPDPGPGSEGLEDLHQALYDGIEHPGNVFYAFVVRVLMGMPVHTKDGEVAHVPRKGDIIWAGEDKRQLTVIPGTSPPLHFHSLVAEKGEVVRRHREFVSFDGDNIVARYLVAYRREWDDDIIVKIPGKVKLGSGDKKESGGGGAGGGGDSDSDSEPEEVIEMPEDEMMECTKCKGTGFMHKSSMPHQARNRQRCFFCQDCDKCDGSGSCAYEPPCQSEQDCFKCKGRGFSHDSNMSHDTGPSERCFFCEDCNSCEGVGRITDAKKCFKCHGRGFWHYRGMSHSEGRKKRCFFCDDCRECDGKGWLHDV